MSELDGQHCEVCRNSAPLANPEEIKLWLQEIPKWHLVDIEGTPQLERQFRFKNYAKAVMFANAVAALSEDQGHHPQIVLEWGLVIVRWWTHKINGLHRNDFICARSVDQLPLARLDQTS